MAFSNLMSNISNTARDMASSLSLSENQVAQGIGESLRAFADTPWSSEPPSTQPPPLLVEFGKRTIALGRKHMGKMSGKNAFLYVKSKFGLLNASTPLHLQAKFNFEGSSTEYVEIDLEAWEEMVPYIQKLRIMT
ncbi:hypothetical protein D9758_012956 [Tetrapyrgos nigripes]|uniref:Uncharacterized protein n=1 Tax=Tetrapyrgos nigripes TaxID=182062 RepID=A0A8H5FNR5_9AGAR|nr:hypothetical protein D9758_012956 [Tetrapyrgos nigripes]